MSELAPVLTGCHVCRSPLIETINKKIKDGVPDQKISDWLKENNAYVSRVTIGRHKRDHLMDKHEKARVEAVKILKDQQKTLKADGDLATLVRNQVNLMLEDGIIMPTLSEGLRAQEIIDRRNEKSTDRDLTIMLAQVLGGVAVIEGTAKEVVMEINDGIS
ncbi:hypothetical protein UFOVP1344_43 [uncultured Caudovirales phage]|uniref:Uncharacterized protein n=1 Tax=uncultured Caudovirales phage TaxID=2100421 RepID=A0A6J5Q5P9_9CAUD|nr:hypothetical protein UFOVP1005_43 [uncultured Caudovirales phage]CAB4200391.1 hypothetical protein UFOVP1344_43 [uncultured Caudovirales phage]CAB4218683.1 hypothetical protein UFOVP1602_45 [uncultured Caudovirales phage]